MSRYIAKAILTLLFLLDATAVFAGPVESLLALDHQPSVTEIKAAFGERLPNENPFGAPTKSLQKVIVSNGPKVIAMFERAYPGATYAPLGRDSVFLGDILDAFYQSLGQSRVRRVSASGHSLEGHAHLAVRFLKSSGFDIAHIDTAFPFIMFDQTNWKSESQSVTYVRAVAEECARLKCDANKLFEKFNFINTGASHNMYPHNIMNAAFDLNAFFKATLRTIQSSGLIFDILSIPVERDLVYTDSYHGTFGKFTLQADGSVIARPGPMASSAVRRQILADVFEMIRSVSSANFRVLVEFAADQLGYEFPNVRVHDALTIARIRGTEPKSEKEDRVAAKNLDVMRPEARRNASIRRLTGNAVKALPDRTEESVPSENWELLKLMLDESIDLTPDYLATSLSFLFELVEKLHLDGKLSRADVREFILYLMANRFLDTNAMPTVRFSALLSSESLLLAIQQNKFIHAELERHLVWLNGPDFTAARAFIARNDLGLRDSETEMKTGRRYFESLIPDPDRRHGRRNLLALINLGRRLDAASRLHFVNGLLDGTDQGRLSDFERSIVVFDALETLLRHQNARPYKGQANPLKFLFEFNPRLESVLRAALTNLPKVNFPNPAPLSQALVVVLARKDLPLSILPLELKRAAHEIAKPGPDLLDRISNHSNNSLLFEALFSSAIARRAKGEAGLKEKRELTIAYLEASLILLNGEKIEANGLRDTLVSVLKTGIAADKEFQKRFSTLYTYHRPIREAMNETMNAYSAPPREEEDLRKLARSVPNQCSRVLRKIIGL